MDRETQIKSAQEIAHDTIMDVLLRCVAPIHSDPSEQKIWIKKTIEDFSKKIETTWLQEKINQFQALIKALLAKPDPSNKKPLPPKPKKKKRSIRDILATILGMTDEAKESIKAWIWENFGKDIPKPKPKKTKKTVTYDEEICIDHDKLKPGDVCPLCKKGKLYDTKKPATEVLIKMEKQFIKRIKFNLQRLRCFSCSAYFTAKRTPEAGEVEGVSKEVAAYLGSNRTDGGMPYNRIAQLFKGMGISISKQKAYEICRSVKDIGKPIVEAMKKEIAQCPVLANDSTEMKILSVSAIKEDPNYKPGTKKNPKDRSSSRASIVIGYNDQSEFQGIIFETSQRHSGEVMGEILELRNPDLNPPLVMADMASTSDSPQNYDRAGCNDHVLRQLVEFSENYPQLIPCVTLYKKVYTIDAFAKIYELTPQERLKLHQEQSTPLILELKENALDILQGLNGKIRAEPNSQEGAVLKYMLKNWDEFTQFLRIIGAPLSNCDSEQAAKKPIYTRKSSCFYRTQEGAEINDVINTLLHTAARIGINSYQYLIDILSNQSSVRKMPHLWTPRAYQNRQQARASPS